MRTSVPMQGERWEGLIQSQAALVKGPESGVRINLVGGQTFDISGDKAKMKVGVATNMEIKTSIQEFLILEHDSEPLVMGVQWHSSLVGEYCGDSTR